MYKWKTGWEKDHERWEWVEETDRCEECGKINRECECSSGYTDDPDEPPVEKSFCEKYGFDERDGPPEEEEDDDNAPWDKWDR